MPMKCADGSLSSLLNKRLIYFLPLIVGNIAIKDLQFLKYNLHLVLWHAYNGEWLLYNFLLYVLAVHELNSLAHNRDQYFVHVLTMIKLAPHDQPQSFAPLIHNDIV